MRRLTRRSLGRRGREAGLSAVVFALVAPVLIGAVGFSIDTGNLTVQKGSVQRAADAAATAIGQDCATKRASCTTAGGTATAQLMINGNAPGATPSVASGLAPSRGQVTVTVTQTVNMRFVSVIGVGPQTVTRSATVEWGQTPIAGTTLPMGMTACDVIAQTATSPSTARLFRYDSDQPGRSNKTSASNCTGPGGRSDTSIQGGLWMGDDKAVWFDASNCKLKSTVGMNDKLNPSRMFSPKACLDRFDTGFVTNKTYLLTVFASPGWNGWGNASATIRGYVPFVLTGYRVDSNSGVKTSSPAPVGCTGSCRGVVGYFASSAVRLEGIDTYGTNPNGDYGAIRVKQTS